MTLSLFAFQKPPRGERPPLCELESLRSEGVSQQKIADLYGVSLRTVSTWHAESGCYKRVRPETEDVDGARQAMQALMGGLGQTWGRRNWQGHLRALGHTVRAETVRGLLHELNPHGNQVRLQRQLTSTACVPGHRA